MLLLGSFLLGVLSASCDPSAGALLSADKQFAAAQTALATHDADSAKAAYENGMQQLAATPWFINAKACDPPQYTLERYTVSLHSLIVGENLGNTGAIAAFTAAGDMWNGITQPPGAPPGAAGTATRTFMFDYPDVFKQMSGYEAAIRKAYNDVQAARHAPASGSRSERTLAADYVRDSAIWWGTFMQAFMQYVPSLPKGHYDAVVSVVLGADGSVQSAQIARSSGQRKIDDEALQVAKRRRYLPQIQDCQRVPSTYAYDFSLNTTADTGLPGGVLRALPLPQTP
jgi:TonB family protein